MVNAHKIFTHKIYWFSFFVPVLCLWYSVRVPLGASHFFSLSRCLFLGLWILLRLLLHIIKTEINVSRSELFSLSFFHSIYLTHTHGYKQPHVFNTPSNTEWLCGIYVKPANNNNNEKYEEKKQRTESRLNTTERATVISSKFTYTHIYTQT